MLLSKYLKRAGVVSGSLFSSDNTSHSGLQRIKRALLGLPQFKGNEQFLYFGNAVHAAWLEKIKEHRLTQDEHKLLTAMVGALNKNTVAKFLISDAVTEKKEYKVINGVVVAYILDILKKSKRIGADLKTTSVKSKTEFDQKAIDYGYFSQADLYMLAENLNQFYFIGITKETNPKVFILDVTRFPDELAYARKENEFLLYFFKNYGKIIAEEERQKGSSKVKIKFIMTGKGKEALAKIKSLNKEAKAAKKAAEKSAVALSKAIEKFPTKEKELYQEQLDKLAEI
jgi:hypothetical protein